MGRGLENEGAIKRKFGRLNGESLSAYLLSSLRKTQKQHYFLISSIFPKMSISKWIENPTTVFEKKKLCTWLYHWWKHTEKFMGAQCVSQTTTHCHHSASTEARFLQSPRAIAMAESRRVQQRHRNPSASIPPGALYYTFFSEIFSPFLYLGSIWNILYSEKRKKKRGGRTRAL